MRALSLCLILVLVSSLLCAGHVSIFEIQHTNNPGSDGTYPSPLRGQVVTTTGIVTAIDTQNNGFYISEPEGGPWKGIYIQHHRTRVSTGDKLLLSGEVSENYGLTTLRNLTQMEILSSGNPLPAPYPVSTSELAVSERYESVLVQVNNVTVIGTERQKALILINDGSGVCRVNHNFLAARTRRNVLNPEEQFTKIIGIVDYRYGEYRLNPRNMDDVVRSPLGAGRSSWGKIKFLYR